MKKSNTLPLEIPDMQCAGHPNTVVSILPCGQDRIHCTHDPERGRVEALEREVRELRQADELPRLASICFTLGEIDQGFTP